MGKRGLALVALALILTSLLQHWVGGFTVYARPDAVKLRLHRAILENQLPAGYTWYTIGGNGTNVRILSVYAAEGLHRSTGVPLLQIYRAIDSAALFLALLCLPLFLARWFQPVWCLLGLLYYSLAAVLSYHFFYFHPWDRPSQLLWLLLVFLLLEGRTALLAAALAIGMTLKNDVILFPALYFLCAVTRERAGSVGLWTALLFGVTLGVNAGLQAALPGGFDREGFGTLAGAVAQIQKNWEHFWTFRRSYPPLLALALPIALSWLHLREKPRFLLAATVFAHGMILVHLALSNFQEVRALLYLLILLLPSALWSLRRLLEAQTGDAVAAPGP